MIDLFEEVYAKGFIICLLIISVIYLISIFQVIKEYCVSFIFERKLNMDFISKEILILECNPLRKPLLDIEENFIAIHLQNFFCILIVMVFWPITIITIISHKILILLRYIVRIEKKINNHMENK